MFFRFLVSGKNHLSSYSHVENSNREPGGSRFNWIQCLSDLPFEISSNLLKPHGCVSSSNGS